METYAKIIAFIKKMPSDAKLILGIGIVVFILYTLYKKKKSKGISPFEELLGKEFRANLKSLKNSVNSVKNSKLKDRLETIVSVSRKIYKKIIKLNIQEINQKLGEERNSSIICFVREQLKLTVQLIENYISIESEVSYTPEGEKLFLQNDLNNAFCMEGIEKELMILERAFTNLYNDIETALNGKYARLIRTEPLIHNEEAEEQDNQNISAGANVEEVRQIIIQLNKNINHNDFK